MSRRRRAPAVERVLLPTEREWPAGLRRLERPPARLRVVGKLLPTERSVAVVGTRFADAEAIAFTRALAADLARAGISVVSGGAYGIDAAAHEGALEAGGHTVAVLAQGFDRPYPPRHGPLFARIALGGALVTERPDGTDPQRWAFLQRNRLIAALAGAVVVVQAPQRSGALSTAAAARRMDIPVFSVPYAPWDERGKGTVGLLKSGAYICTCARDVLSVRPLGSRPGKLPASRDVGGYAHHIASLPADLTDDGRRLYAVLSRRPRHPDELIERARLAPPAVQAALVELVLAGLATDNGDGRYQRT